MPTGIDYLGSVAVYLAESKIDNSAIRDGRIVSRVAFGHKLETPHPDDRWARRTTRQAFLRFGRSREQRCKRDLLRKHKRTLQRADISTTSRCPRGQKHHEHSHT